MRTENIMSDEKTWTPDWAALANQVVNRTLKLAPGERVIYLVDPYEVPGALDEFRAAVLSAGGVEHATILGWSPRLRPLRDKWGQHRDLEARQKEWAAHREIFSGADVFLWLPTEYAILEPEWLVQHWRGRSVHFHWFWDPLAPPGHPIHAAHQQAIERAILQIDYKNLRQRQDKLVEAIRGKRVRITTPQGTDLRFFCPIDNWYHINDGDASREKVLRAICTRDREEEMPPGAVRTHPGESSVEGVISIRDGKPFTSGHRGLDGSGFRDSLEFVFQSGKISQIRSATRQRELDDAKKLLTGDWDRIGEIAFGTNPLLVTPPGAAMPTYYGKGQGNIRIQLGDNTESGGHFRSNMWFQIYLENATAEADGKRFLDNGALLF
jgi:hypothetical protein